MSEIPYSVRSSRGGAIISNITGLKWTDTRDNELIKKIDSTTAGGSGIQTVFDTDPITGTKNDIIISNNQGIFNTVLGAILNTVVGLSEYSMRLIPRSTITNSEAGITIYNDTSEPNDVKVGINISNPEETLEVDGSIQIDSANIARLKFQQSGATPHALGEIDGQQDGANGGDLQFYTKVDGSSQITEKLRINNIGAIGIGGANFGTTGQVLTSNDSGGSVSWTTPTFPVDLFISTGTAPPTTPGGSYFAPGAQVLNYSTYNTVPGAPGNVIQNVGTGRFTIQVPGQYMILSHSMIQALSFNATQLEVRLNQNGNRVAIDLVGFGTGVGYLYVGNANSTISAVFGDIIEIEGVGTFTGGQWRGLNTRISFIKIG